MGRLWPSRSRTPDVEKLRRDDDRSGLEAALDHTDPIVARDGGVIDRGAPVRAAALRALAEMDSPEVPALAGALSDESPGVARTAAEALATVGSQDAIDELVEFLAVKGRAVHPDVRAAALQAVCASGHPGLTELWCRKVVEGRHGVLDDVDRREFAVIMGADAAEHPAQGLFDLLVPRLASNGAGPDRAGPAEAILSWCMPAELDQLVPVLASRDVPLAAVRLAGLSGSQALLQPLVELLEHDSKPVRREAVSALGALCDTATVLPLLGATTDPDVTVRRRAVIALDSLGSAGVTAAMALLVQAAGDRPAIAPAEPTPAVGGDRWGRTLERLAERTGLLGRAQRRQRNREPDRYEGLIGFRTRYEALMSGADLPEPPDGEAPPSGSSEPAG